MHKLNFILFLLFLFGCSGNKPTQTKDSEADKKPTENTTDTNKNIPESGEMIFFEAGTFLMGSENGLPQEAPVHEVSLKAFYIDKSPVTVAQFRQFVESTGHKTEAENYGDSGVFNLEQQNWELLAGANWRKPFGPAGPDAEDNHPVTHVSWNDANAYAAWAGKRLPTEAEWEYAARSGKNSENKFAWGNQLEENGQYFCNTWQGEIAAPQVKDGHLYTSPVGAFGENEAGLTDMGGNVWQWCADNYAAYPGSSAPIQENPTVKTIRSGSFFYDAAGEASLTVSFRSGNSHETSLFNTGFRCAKDGGESEQ